MTVSRIAALLLAAAAVTALAGCGRRASPSAAHGPEAGATPAPVIGTLPQTAPGTPEIKAPKRAFVLDPLL